MAHFGPFSSYLCGFWDLGGLEMLCATAHVVLTTLVVYTTAFPGPPKTRSLGHLGPRNLRIRRDSISADSEIPGFQVPQGTSFGQGMSQPPSANCHSAWVSDNLENS